MIGVSALVALSIVDSMRYSAGEEVCPSPRSPRLGALLRVAAGVLMPSREDVGVPRSFAAARLGVTPHTVSMWVQRGYRLVETTEDGEPRVEHRTVRVVGHWRGQRLYRWGDLVDAERATRNNRRSSRHRDRASVGVAA